MTTKTDRFVIALAAACAAYLKDTDTVTPTPTGDPGGACDPTNPTCVVKPTGGGGGEVPGGTDTGPAPPPYYAEGFNFKGWGQDGEVLRNSLAAGQSYNFGIERPAGANPLDNLEFTLVPIPGTPESPHIMAFIHKGDNVPISAPFDGSWGGGSSMAVPPTEVKSQGTYFLFLRVGKDGPYGVEFKHPRTTVPR